MAQVKVSDIFRDDKMFPASPTRRLTRRWLKPGNETASRNIERLADKNETKFQGIKISISRVKIITCVPAMHRDCLIWWKYL